MSESTSGRSNIVIMLLSAALFGWFGFGTSWNYKGVNGEFLFFVALLDWTLKGSAVAFAVSAGLTFVHAGVGNLIYSVCGLLGAVSFLIVAILDIMDTQHMAMSPVLLFIFAIWNGYGSIVSLQQMFSKASPRADTLV